MQNVTNNPAKIELNKGFVVISKESRFYETTKIGGVNPNDIKISSKDTSGNFSMFEYQGNDKGGPPLHVHPYQDEVFYILEGDYLFQIDTEIFNLKQGDTIFLPRQIPHTFAQLSNKGKMLFFFNPAGKMEDFFRTLGNLPGPPTPEEGGQIFESHEMIVVGPPLDY